MSASIRDLLNAKLDVLPSNLKEGKVITVDKTASLQSVLELLSKHDIRSLPVVDTTNGDKLLGVVDMVDIVTFVVRFAEECLSLPAAKRNFEWFTQQLDQTGQDISQIAGLSHKNPYIPVQSGTSIFDIIQIMVSCGVQRVPVINPQNHLENFVTQSAFVEFFAKHLNSFGELGECTLSELGFKPKQVHAVKENATAIESFKLMSTHKITGVPVVDLEGEIITNISSKELRHILTDPHFFDKLQLPTERFVSDLKSKTFLHKSETMYPKICCHFSDKFSTVLNKLAATKIHRIYVVDAYQRPIGVISLDDIVSKVYDLATTNEVPHAKNHLSAQ
jgi:CBS domain-containing protein